jgi:hypothetical protein
LNLKVENLYKRWKDTQSLATRLAASTTSPLKRNHRHLLITRTSIPTPLDPLPEKRKASRPALGAYDTHEHHHVFELSIEEAQSAQDWPRLRHTRSPRSPLTNRTNITTPSNPPLKKHEALRPAPETHDTHVHHHVFEPSIEEA